MDNQSRGHDQAGKSEAVADPLHGGASRAQGGRGDERAAEVVDDAPDGDVGGRDTALADDQGAGVVTGVPHLGHDGEEGRRAGEGEDQGGQRRRGLGEGRAPDDLVVRSPVALLGRGGRSILDSYGDGDGKDCVTCGVSRLLFSPKGSKIARRHVARHLLEDKMQTRPIHANQVILPSVWMLPKPNPMRAATATKTAVHAPCMETALSAIEAPSMPEPATKIQSVENV